MYKRKSTSEVTNEQPGINQRSTTSKQYKLLKVNNIYIVHFENIWERYPTKVGKEKALRSFKSSVKTDSDLADINKALVNYLKSKRVQDGYIQNGSKWFSQWRDWVDFEETSCMKCGGSGKYTSTTARGSYTNTCECRKGKIRYD